MRGVWWPWSRRARAGRVVWGRVYPDWASAQRDSTGYDADEIIGKVAAATRAVQRGESPYERDSVLFDHVEYSWPLLSSLLWIHARLGRLRVLDFGGSLGSTWRQNRAFLRDLPSVEWKVVEQESFVELGRAEFQTPQLSFHRTVEEASAGGVDLFLMASSLCYIEDHAAILRLAADSGARFLAIDRTPFTEDDRDTIRLQTVPPEIYRASYPCWIFSRPRFLEALSSTWRLHSDWECELQPDPGAVHHGMILERMDP